MKSVTNKTALVTGGARGMGLIWVHNLLRDGANVIIWGTDEIKLKSAQLDLSKKYSKRKISIQRVDVGDESQIIQAAEIALREQDIDILVNNAGIMCHGPFVEVSSTEHSRIIDVNLKSIIWTMKCFLPGMLERNIGHIVNVASAAGFTGIPNMSAYVASKWGVIGLSESVRLEVRAMGKNQVNFTVFCPSYVDTGMFDGAKPPFLTRWLNPTDTVDLAYKAFKKNISIVIDPPLARVIPVSRSLLPTKIHDLLSGILGISSSMSK